MTKLNLRYILEETSKSVTNGRTIETLQKWKNLLKEEYNKEDKKSLKNAITILEEVIRLKKKKNKTGGEIFKQSFLFIIFLVLLVGIQASINHNIGGENRLIVGENISTFIGDVNVTGNIEVVGNITVDTVFDNTIFAQLSSFVNQEPTNTSPVVITYNTQDDINGLTHSTSINPGEITINTEGVYFISPQPQVGKNMGGVKVDFDMFLQVNRNGTFINEPNSNIKLTIKDPDITDVIVLSFTISLNSGDKIRMMQRVSDSAVGMGLKNTNITGEIPRTPAIIFTMYRVGG